MDFRYNQSDTNKLDCGYLFYIVRLNRIHQGRDLDISVECTPYRKSIPNWRRILACNQEQFLRNQANMNKLGLRCFLYIDYSVHMERDSMDSLQGRELLRMRNKM